MTTQATPLWNNKRIEARCDALTPGEADMGEMEYWNTLRDLALRVGIEIRDEYESALDQAARESNMIFDRGAQRLAQLKECQAALAERDARIAELEANADPEALMICYGKGLVEGQEKSRLRIKELEAQLAHITEWRARWKRMAKHKLRHHRNAIAVLGGNIEVQQELSEKVRRLDERVAERDAEIASLKSRCEAIFGDSMLDLSETELERYAQLSPPEMFRKVLALEATLAEANGWEDVPFGEYQTEAERVILDDNLDAAYPLRFTIVYGDESLACGLSNTWRLQWRKGGE